MVSHWLLRIGDGEHFISSSSKNIWGICSSNSCSGTFIKEAKEGDKLWFIKSNSKGKAISVATFLTTQKRELGPLIDVSYTNEELGWVKQKGDWDIEVHYKDLYNIYDCDMCTNIQSPLVIRIYNPEKCSLNLPEEYKNIVKYCGIKRTM